LFSRIADEVEAAVVGVWGRAEARALGGRGAGGDSTVYIDSLAEDIVLARLAEAHQHGLSFNLISEEAGERDYGGGETIVVDPIDGSHNAKMGIPYFSLTLAAARDRTYGSVFEGCVRNLVTGDHFEARRGAGASLNGAALQLVDEGDTVNVLQIETTDLGAHLEEYVELVRRAQKVRVLGSAALNICLVASGAMSLSIAPALRSVDCAAALLILSEAGGVATNMEGQELGGLDMALAVRPSVVAAANQALLDSALRSLGPRR
jgi:fructose-1,6-bisphosphatase/inositol monophosphatase family enzyme